MAAGALTQLVDAHWQSADTLVVDMPPGTGDVQLTMMQKHRPAGAVIVSTPQDLALIDATRAIDLFVKAGVPIIGLVENMAGYVCPHCGEASDPFGNGGAEAKAQALGIPFLGRVPLTLAIRTASDAGVPPAAGNGAEADPFMSIAAKVGDWLARN
jgi:ATP-binding protein involved in chromosome partitioning